MNVSTAVEIVYPIVVVQEGSCCTCIAFLLFLAAPFALCFFARPAPPPSPPVVVQASPA